MKQLLSTYRVRNTIVAGGLAVLGAVLVFLYVATYRNSVESGANLVTVFVADRDIPAGLDGASAAGGDYLKKETVLRRSVVPGAITSLDQIADLAVGQTILAGQQLTVRQFRSLAEEGVLASISGNQRAMTIPGSRNQLLVGLVEDGDRVDVLANIKYVLTPPEGSTGGDSSKVVSRVILRNLLVLQAPGSGDSGSFGTEGRSASIALAVTDAQAQKLLFAVQNGTWWLALRPVAKPSDSPDSAETMESVLADGLAPRQLGQVTGGLPRRSIGSE